MSNDWRPYTEDPTPKCDGCPGNGAWREDRVCAEWCPVGLEAVARQQAEA